MTDGQRNAAAWLQYAGWSVVMLDTGFVAVHQYLAAAIMATERKTILQQTDDKDVTRSLIRRRTANVEIVKEMLATIDIMEEPAFRENPECSPLRNRIRRKAVDR